VSAVPDLRISRRAISISGLALLLVGAGLVSAVALATGAGAAGQSITVTPHHRLTAAKHVVVSGSGFAHRSAGILLECNTAVGEPALAVTVNAEPHLVPIGCTQPLPVTTTEFGKLRPRTLPVVVGTLGAWETATDSAGLAAATDSAGYPCPPTAAQVALGASCVFEFLDNKGQEGTRSVTFNPATSTVTTTTTTTTTEPGGNCTPYSATASGLPGSASPSATATVDPATCLVNGSQVDVSAAGLSPASVSNYLGTFIECNTDPNQPTVSILGNVVPVSCTSALKYVFTPNAAGTANTADLPPPATPYFTVIEGTTGPACAPSLCNGTDSTGGDPYTDAAEYPCPPTAAEQAAGDVCVISVSDTGGDRITVPISFDPTSTSTEAQARLR
jgi:hypothetical protein